MKSFFNYISIFSVILIVGAVFSACSSSDEIITEEPQQPTGPKTYTMTVQASKGGDANKTRALSLEGKTLSATWATSEHVYVKKGSDWATGSLQPQEAGTSTTLKGTLENITINSGDNLTLQFPKSGDITYAGQLGTIADIAANYDYATASVTVANVNGGSISTNDDANFVNQQAIIKFTLLDKANNTAISPSALTVTDGISTVSLTDIPAATYTANEATNVLYVAFPAAGSDKTFSLTATVGDNTYTYSKSGVTFENGKFYDIAVKMNAATPLTMEATTAGTIVVKNPRSGMKYSLNGGDKTTMTETTTIGVAKGDKVQFYGDGTSINKYYYSWSYTNIAGGSAEVKVYGNIMSLVDETGYASNTKLTGEYAFQYLFKENTTLTDASGLLLPATTLTMACYDGMFSGCSILITAPALPATTLTAGCYSNMFLDCFSLTTAPVLPAKTLANYCYNCMFSGCSSLNSVTCLATDNNAYESTSYWLDGVASSGTFTKAKNVSWVTASHGIPYGWTVVEAE